MRQQAGRAWGRQRTRWASVLLAFAAFMLSLSSPLAAHAAFASTSASYAITGFDAAASARSGASAGIATDDESASPGPHAVLILTGGLRWDQLDHSRAPYLSELAAAGTAGNLIPLSVRGASCPIDSWLALAGGQRASARSLARDATCPMPDVAAGARIAEYSRFQAAIERQGAGRPVGVLARAFREAGYSVHAIGEGAAYTLADSRGFVPFDYEAAPRTNIELGEAVAASAARFNVTVVDADAESYASDEERIAARLELEQWARAQAEAGRDPDDEYSGQVPADIVDGTLIDSRREKVAAINIFRLERILERLPEGTRVMVASVVGLDTTPYMQIMVAGDAHRDESPAGQGADSASVDAPGSAAVGAQGPWPALTPSLASSPSVRQVGAIQLADLVPTLCGWFGVESPARTGTALAPIAVAEAGHSVCTPDEECYIERREMLTNQARHAGHIRTLRGAFIRYLTLAAVFYFLACLALAAQPCARRTLTRRPVRAIWAWAGFTISTLPLASFLLNLTPWWNAPSPRLALFAGSWALAGVLAVGFLGLTRWRPEAGMLTLWGVTALALTADAATGSHVMADSPIGFNLLTGARFYGVGNEGYSLIAAGALMVLAWLSLRCGALTSRARTLLAVTAISLIGLVIAAIDALPMLGADFGGALSFLPALFALAMMLSGIRFTPARMIAIGAGTALVAGGIAVADWLRPAPSRTHLGNFVQSVADGEAGTVIIRKAATNLRLLSATMYRWVVLAAIVLFLLVMLRALMRRPAPAASGRALGARAIGLWGPWWAWLAPSRLESQAHETLSHRYPWLRIGLIAEAICFTLAFALNDSGIVLPGIAAILVLPPLLAFIVADRCAGLAD